MRACELGAWPSRGIVHRPSGVRAAAWSRPLPAWAGLGEFPAFDCFTLWHLRLRAPGLHARVFPPSLGGIAAATRAGRVLALASLASALARSADGVAV